MSRCLVLKVLKDLALSEWRVPNVPISLGYWQPCWVSSANYCGHYHTVKLRNSDISKCRKGAGDQIAYPWLLGR